MSLVTGFKTLFYRCFTGMATTPDTNHHDHHDHHPPPPMATAATPLHVVVVGGGIAGLSAAIALRLAGHNVTVLEAAEKIEEIGAGLQLSANATRILAAWGLDDKALGSDVVEPYSCIMKRWRDGVTIAAVPLHAHHRAQYGGPFWDIHRHDLIVALLARAEALGARFVPTDQPEYTGDMAFRVLLTLADLPAAARASLDAVAATPQCTYWLGPRGPAKGGKQINLVAVAPDDLPAGVIRAPCPVEDVLTLFKDWDPLLKHIMSQEKTIWKWKLHKRPPLENWCHPSGRFTLIGDAVHPTLPYLSQGAGISLEDAAVLGQVLAEKLPLAEALKKYEALRRPRTTKIVHAATRQQFWYHLPDGEKQEARDAIMGDPESREGDPFLWREPVFAPWLYGYDAYKEAKKATAASVEVAADKSAE
ncbi:Aromatic-ring hydroxylase-like protein [Niveomyces insectorum RCEF 264]|uniref:Aromatic-ring hydroxylase-like protein n=1 Tax=Niveomyces insectorum RCEF 264 TaxID=1081102 RepID=A0A167TXC5_9HYPO|nr:Aromatic-ring hydroxylase-like protein [Niveomyces insectorum RCEF 264]